MTMRESCMRPPILTSNIFCTNNSYNIMILIYMYVQHLNKTLEKLQWRSINTFRIITDLRCDGHCITIYM